MLVPPSRPVTGCDTSIHDKSRRPGMRPGVSHGKARPGAAAVRSRLRAARASVTWPGPGARSRRRDHGDEDPDVNAGQDLQKAAGGPAAAACSPVSPAGAKAPTRHCEHSGPDDRGRPAGPRRHGLRPRDRQARRPRPALIRQLRPADHARQNREARGARPGRTLFNVGSHNASASPAGPHECTRTGARFLLPWRLGEP